MIHEKKLANGVSIPVVGLGTWKLGENAEETIRMVQEAVKYGYRRIDTAAGYQNEEAIGTALKNSGIARKDLFLTTKIDDIEHAYLDAKRAVYRSLEKLKTDYLDLCLIHSPNSKRMWEYARNHGYDSNDYRRKLNVQAWKALCELQQEGVICGAGVSNFSICHIEEIVKETAIYPLFNQIKLCVGCYSHQKDIIDYCRKHQIQIEAYRPLGRGKIAKLSCVQKFARKYQMTPYQVGLHFLRQENVCIIPKASKKEHMIDNLKNYEVMFSEKEMDELREIIVEEKWAEVKNPDIF